MRTLAAAVALTLLLPAPALAHETLDGSRWPTADELRRDLQDIGYEFIYDATAQAYVPAFNGDWAAVWMLAEPAVVDEEMPPDVTIDPFTLRLIDAGGRPVQIVFSAASMDDGEGEMEAIATVLMEVAARLPQGNGLDAAVWYMSNQWLHPEGAQERSTLPCLVEEFEGGATLVWPASDGEGLTSFYGTVGLYEETPEEIRQCQALQAQEAADAASATPAEPGEPDEPAAEGTDFSVTSEEAVALIEAGEHTVIDVRTPAEFEQAHVVGAVNIDVEAADFAGRIAELDPDAPYLLYCRTGRRSDLAAQQMAAAGFTDIADAAGLVGLARAGAPIE